MVDLGDNCPEGTGSGKMDAQHRRLCNGKGRIIVHSRTHIHGGRPHDHPHPEPHHSEDKTVHEHRHHR